MNKEQTLTGVIRGTGACVPKRVMDNDEIAGFVELVGEENFQASISDALKRAEEVI